MIDLEVQLARYGDVIEEAADAAHTRLESTPPKPLVVDQPRRRPVLLAAAVVVLVAVLAVGALLALQDTGSQSNRSIVANGGGRGTIIDAPLPDGIPSDWKTVEYDGVRVSVPPTWKLLQAGACPGQENTILTGAAGKHCATPKDGAWVWLAPNSLASAHDRRNCGDGQIGSLPVCLVLTAKANDLVERALMTGSDSMYIGGSGARTPSPSVNDTLRPVDANAAAPPATFYAAAVAFTNAYLTGDCATIKAQADHTYDGGCPAASPLASADGTAPKVQRSASTQGYDPNDAYARLYFDDTHAYEIRLRHQWSSDARRGEWKTVSIKPVDPTEAWPTSGPIGSPSCTPVSDHGGRTPGCIRREDLFPTGDPHAFDAHQADLTSRYGGTPVYANANSDKIVGVMAASQNGEINLGFVPKKIVPKIPQLQACINTWSSALQAKTRPQVSGECRTLMRAYGLSNARIDGSR